MLIVHYRESSNPLTESIAFGFSRYICVGGHFADISLWSIFSKVLAVFNLLRSKEANGVEISVTVEEIDEWYRRGNHFSGLGLPCIRYLISDIGVR